MSQVRCQLRLPAKDVRGQVRVAGDVAVVQGPGGVCIGGPGITDVLRQPAGELFEPGLQLE